MVLSGYTVDAYKADSVSKSFIYFYIADSVPEPKEYDSTLFNYKPQVIARAETNGIFLAQNLKPVPYRVYAFQDTNDNQMYEPSIDKVGFLDSLINPALMPDFSVWYDSLRHYVTADPQVFMRMFTDVAFKRQTLQQSERPARHKAMLYFGAAHPEVTGLRFDSIPAERVIWDPQTVGRDTVALWFDVPSASLPDTIKGEITYFKHDTVNRLQEVTEPLKLAWRYIESKSEEKEREKLEREPAVHTEFLFSPSSACSALCCAFHRMRSFLCFCPAIQHGLPFYSIYAEIKLIIQYPNIRNASYRFRQNAPSIIYCNVG